MNVRSAITACARDYQYPLHFWFFSGVERTTGGDNEILRFNRMMSWLLLVFLVKAYPFV
jgi:hypothetical protein